MNFVSQTKLSYGEAFYLLFKKKICPKCQGALKRSKVTDEYIVDEASKLPKNMRSWRSASSGAGNFNMIGAVRVREHSYQFDCEECEAQFPLAKLAKR